MLQAVGILGFALGAGGGGTIEEDFECENLIAYGDCLVVCNQDILFTCKVDCIRSKGVYCGAGECEEGLESVRECITFCENQGNYKNCEVNCRLKC